MNLRLDVKDVSLLARLPLSSDEAEILQPQLDQVVRFINELASVDVEAEEGAGHIDPRRSVLRADNPAPCMPRDAMLGNAPMQDGEHVLVPVMVS